MSDTCTINIFSAPVKLVIADDHPLLVDGLVKVLLEIGRLEIVDTVENGADLLRMLRRVQVDMVLLDLQMPMLDGIATLKILHREFPLIKVLVFSNYGQSELIKEIKMLGASGFILKDSSSTLVKEAVITVAKGEEWFTLMEQPAAISIQFSNDFMKKFQITTRETEIIGLIANGLTTKAIAAKLFVSEFTINTHRRNIARKLNIYTPVGLLNFAKSHGLIS